LRESAAYDAFRPPATVDSCRNILFQLLILSYNFLFLFILYRFISPSGRDILRTD
jgi:hypothetical protein